LAADFRSPYKDTDLSALVYRGVAAQPVSVYNGLDDWVDGKAMSETDEPLFQRFYWPLFRFFTRRGFNTEECQDLIQETFLKVDLGLAGFREESGWAVWIFRIAANTASNAVRHDNATKRSGDAVAAKLEGVADSLSEAAGGISHGSEAPTEPDDWDRQGHMRETGKVVELFQRLESEADPEESFRLLFHRFYGPLFRFFTRRGFNSEECQDLIQETFLKVDRGLSGFREESRLESWIFKIAAHTASNAVRHDNAAKRSGDSVAAKLEDVADSLSEAAGGISHGSEAPAPLRQLLGKETTMLLSQAVDRLPAQMRRCVRLRVFEDLDYTQIANVLQISSATVKVQLFKARKRLQIELKDHLADFDL
jgi:RNA polymerase sigma-70 factor (ECF subfamily)